MTEIIDTHCHPQMAQFDPDRDEVIRRAQDEGIGMVCVGVDLESSRKAIMLAEQYAGVYASVGLHPNDNLDEKYDEQEYEALAMHEKVIAIGEVGLDYYRTADDAKRVFQRERFIQQMALAQRLDKPLIIHCRDAHDDMLALLTSGRGVIHSFNGTRAHAEKYLERGWYLGLNAIVTYADEYREMVRSLPLDRILLETDAPYLAPGSHRGKRNESSYIRETAELIAGIRGESKEMLIQASTANALVLGLYR